MQRQKWLLENQSGITHAEAYDQARKEFYQVRYEEDVARRVAKEEALAVGAQFGKSYMEIGMELEDRQYEEWRAWALSETIRVEQLRASSYTGGEEEEGLVDETPLLEDGVDPVMARAEQEEMVRPLDEGDAAAPDRPARASPVQRPSRPIY